MRKQQRSDTKKRHRCSGGNSGSQHCDKQRTVVTSVDGAFVQIGWHALQDVDEAAAAAAAAAAAVAVAVHLLRVTDWSWSGGRGGRSQWKRPETPDAQRLGKGEGTGGQGVVTRAVTPSSRSTWCGGCCGGLWRAVQKQARSRRRRWLRGVAGHGGRWTGRVAAAEVGEWVARSRRAVVVCAGKVRVAHPLLLHGVARPGWWQGQRKCLAESGGPKKTRTRCHCLSTGGQVAPQQRREGNGGLWSQLWSHKQLGQARCWRCWCCWHHQQQRQPAHPSQLQ